MQLPSTTKIEHRALNVLESIIDEHTTMLYEFNQNDKEMSWDGYILLCKTDNGVQSKQNFEGRIPVQIKGHSDPKHKYLNRDRITYSVALSDLEAYATEKGVLYFQIFLGENEREIFYASLYPSKIADYLDTAKKRRNTTALSIPFIKLEKTAEKMYTIVKQFHEEAKKQGSAYTPLVQDRIKVDDFDKLKSINLTVVGAKDPYSMLSRLSTGDVCLYGKTEGDKYSRPLEWIDSQKFFVGTTVNHKISINGEVFYKHYKSIISSDGKIVLDLSPNLELCLTEKEFKFNFKVKSSLHELGQDALFLLRLKNASSFFIELHEYKYTDSDMSPEFEKRLHFIVDLCETMEMIEFDTNRFELSKCSDIQQAQLVQLVNLRLGTYNRQLEDGHSKYTWIFGDKLVPLLIDKEENKIKLVNQIYTNKIAIFLPCVDSIDEKGYRMPLFAYQDVETLANLYYYDYDIFRYQIDESDINERTAGALTDCVLLLISVFDANSDLHFLDLAEYLLGKLEPFAEKELTLLNRMQIRKRKKTFDSSDTILLNSIVCNEVHVMFGKSVLLEDKTNAEMYFEQFTEDEKIMYKGFPIYKLFLEL